MCKNPNQSLLSLSNYFRIIPRQSAISATKDSLRYRPSPVHIATPLTRSGTLAAPEKPFHHASERTTLLLRLNGRFNAQIIRARVRIGRRVKSSARAPVRPSAVVRVVAAILFIHHECECKWFGWILRAQLSTSAHKSLPPKWFSNKTHTSYIFQIERGY